jgi:hypothetical protein
LQDWSDSWSPVACVLNEKTISIEACNAVVAEFDQYYDRLIDVALFGYIISTLLILFIFKKVR